MSRRAGCRWLAVFIHSALVGLTISLSPPSPSCPLFSRAMDGEGMGCAGRKVVSNEREGERDRHPDLRSGLACLVSSLDRAPEHPRGAAHFFIPPIKRRPDSEFAASRDHGIRGVSKCEDVFRPDSVVGAHWLRNVRKVSRTRNSSSCLESLESKRDFGCRMRKEVDRRESFSRCSFFFSSTIMQ